MYNPFNRTSKIREILIIDNSIENGELRKLNRKLARKSRIQSITVVGLVLVIVLVTRRNVIELNENFTIKK
jgi:hypothetical protein